MALPAKLAIVLGIRPDVIRASLVLKKLRASDDVDLHFIWSGQHYSDNMKDVFFRELDVAPPDLELGARGESDAEVSSEVIKRLYPVLEEPDARELFVIFRDRTSGRETYGAGRFLYTDMPKDGKLVLDFNRAYNPPCAFTPYATCPLPPKQNQLPVRIEAGELKYADH